MRKIYEAEIKRAKAAEARGEKHTPAVQKVSRYAVDPRTIRIIEGFNIRKLSQEHIDSIAKSYAAGQPVPPVLVAVAADGVLELVDGEHRVRAAIQADMQRIDIQVFYGTEEERVAVAVSSSQGRNLTPDERALAYKRLSDKGWSNDEIAEKVGRSAGDVANHLLLAQCGPKVLEYVASGEIKATPLFSLAREIGPAAVLDRVEQALARKRAAATPPPEVPVEEKKKSGRGTKPGSTKAPRPRIRASDLTLFGKKDYERVTEIAAGLRFTSEITSDDADVMLLCRGELARELKELLNRYAVAKGEE
ncbi:TPA: ParB/RepB/Spo0J family partition protein [Escherichia coli]|nr:ParB/RepB/Spo0J family partition protein [Escherichia coli]ELP7318752.1 ParB/RepB/Spo0J family partition protein [Escherichia coli]HBC3064659.1 ParB/RepB/Spo0J family partition protein [Escherichia coli O146]